MREAVAIASGVMTVIVAASLGTAVAGSLDFNCTSPPLNVSLAAPIGSVGCGV